jgi:hypothetical protein
MEENSGNFQAGWNLAEPMLFDIANRLRQARDCLLAGNLDKYYWNLEVITRMIYGFLEPDERKQALAQEIAIQKHLPCREQTKSDLMVLLKIYDGLIMTLLHNHKFLVPPKKDRTRLIG